MSDLVAPASVADPHRSLVRSVKGVFAGLHRTMEAYDGEGDPIAVAKAALAGAADQLAGLLDQRDKDAAEYAARLAAETKISADVDAAHEPSADSVELTKQAKKIAKS